MELGRVDRLLEVHPEIDVAEERVQRPLLLLVAAGRAPREVRLAVAKREAGAECRARTRSRLEATTRSPSSSQNICARVPSGQPSAGMTGELWSQPPLGVAEIMFPKRSAMSRCTVPRPGSPEPAVASAARSEGRRPMPGRYSAEASSPHERPARVVVLRRQQRLERDVLGVAVQRVAIRERELPALDDHVDELGGRELVEVEALQERELLETDGAGRPRLRLAHRQPAVLEAWRPARPSPATPPGPRR